MKAVKLIMAITVVMIMVGCGNSMKGTYVNVQDGGFVKKNEIFVQR